MRRDQRRSVFVPDKTEDIEANGSINFKRSRLVERAALANAFHSSMPKLPHSTFSVSTDSAPRIQRTASVSASDFRLPTAISMSCYSSESGQVRSIDNSSLSTRVHA